MEKYIYYDDDLGAISIRVSTRATRYTLKISRGKITATIPLDGNEKHMLAFIQKNKERLLKALEKHPAAPFIDESTRLQTATFRLHVFRMERDNFYTTLKEGVLHIACPRTTRFEDEETQKLLKSKLEQALRHEAKRTLPKRLARVAQAYGFTFTDVKVNNSKTRWGSCTTRKSVNLSLSLMLLPWHLIDYVLLHELCHTVEMNHSKRFWRLMDHVTDGKAKALRQELKNHHPI